MHTGIAPGDRKLLLIGGGLLLLFLLANGVLSPPAEQIQSPVPSTYSAQSAGAQAAFRLLTKMHYPVRRWESPPTELHGNDENILLILAEPTQLASETERKALERFVEDGGHVVFTGGRLADYFPSADLSSEPPDPSWRTFDSALPSRITRGAQQITLQPRAVWSKFDANQLSLYGDSDGPVVVTWTLGKGNILWWAGSTPLTNAGITRQDNLAFFLNSVGNWKPTKPYQIYWDEYFHGERSSLWSYVAKTSAAWSGFQLAILAAAVLFTFGRRSGPTFVPREVSRLSPLEFVDTLGGLYERAGAASAAVSVSAARLRSLLARQLGLPVTTPDAALAQAAESRLGYKESGLAEALSQAEVASRAGIISSQEALAIVQELEKWTAQLDVRFQIRRQKR
jgi:hypothetical protein